MANIGGSLGREPYVLLLVYRSVTGKILRIQKELPELTLFSSLPKDGVQPASERA